MFVFINVTKRNSFCTGSESHITRFPATRYFLRTYLPCYRRVSCIRKSLLTLSCALLHPKRQSTDFFFLCSLLLSMILQLINCSDMKTIVTRKDILCSFVGFFLFALLCFALNSFILET